MALQNKVIISAVDRTKKAYTSAKKNTDDLNKSTKKLSNTMKSLAVGYLGVQGIKALADVSDSYQRMNAQIRLVTKEGDNAKDTYRDLLELANETRSSLDGTVVGYSRLARAVATLNVGHEELLLVSQSINQSFRISGSTQKESYNAIIQLSQGLASGALRGEEFNAIAEQAPRIMQALRDELGKTDGELRAMSKQGQITSEMILRTLTNQSDAIAKEFKILPVLVSEALTQLANDANAAFGKTDTSPLVDGINDLRDLLKDEQFMRNIIIAGEGFAALVGFAAKAVAGIAEINTEMGKVLARAVVGLSDYEAIEDAIQGVNDKFAEIPQGADGYIEKLGVRYVSLVDSLALAEEGLAKLKAAKEALSEEPPSSVMSVFVGVHGASALQESGEAIEENFKRAKAEVSALRDEIVVAFSDISKANNDRAAKAEDEPVAKKEYDQNNKWFKATRTLTEKYYLNLASLKKDFDTKKISAATMQRGVILEADNLKKLTDAKANALNKEYDNLVLSLGSEEEAISASYSQQRKIILAQTEATAVAKAALKAKLDAKFGEDILGGFTAVKTIDDEIAEINDRAAAKAEAIRANDELEGQARTDLLIELEESRQKKIEDINQVSQQSQVQAMGGFFTDLASVSKIFGEKHLKLTKALAVTGALISTYAAAVDAYRAMAKFGPPVAAAAAGAAVAAGLANVKIIKSQKVEGAAHGGMTNVPSEATYLLDKGERVLSPNQNKDFTNFIQGSGNNSRPQNVNVTFNISAIDTEELLR